MTEINYKIRLEKLLTNELSLSNDKKQVISAYKSLIDILQVSQLAKKLHGHHEILFQCLSQIILTPFHRFFNDKQLNHLLQSASHACVLSMSQNQIIDGWLQNIEERTFEKPDFYDENDDDDDLYEDVTDTESEEEEMIISKQNKNKKLNEYEKKEQHRTVSFKENISILSQSIENQRDIHRNKNQIDNKSTNDKKYRRKDNENKSKSDKEYKKSSYDNKYRQYNCYICGEYGHIKNDCPNKMNRQTKISSQNLLTTKTKRSSSSIDSIPIMTNQLKIQDIINLASKLINSCQTTNERNETLNILLADLKILQDQYKENLSKIFIDKESIFYSLFSHIAQHDFLFTTEQYLKFYHFKHILLPKQYRLINEDRSMFARQRILTPLDIITQHIQTMKQIQQTIFNDFQEYIIRSTPPISMILYDLIKHLLKTNIHINEDHLKNFTENILFNLKRNLFSNEQIIELQLDLSIRSKRFERSQTKQIWKKRINHFKNSQLSIDLNQWLNEFNEILQTNIDQIEEELSNDIIHHAMWYFAVLIITSSGHLNDQQYEHILNVAIQSRLFNSKQKFYFQFYLQQGHAPITIKELNDIQIELEKSNIESKQYAYQQIRTILNRTKPIESENSIDNLPIIDNHILSRLISLVEIICSDINQFSNEQCKELLDQFLNHSLIVRPIPNAEEKQLKRFYSRPMSLNELKTFCLSTSFDLEIFLGIIQNEMIVKNEDILDYLTEFIGKIFRNRRKYSNEHCQQLKSLIEKQIFGKRRIQILNNIFNEFRVKRKDFQLINPTILNQLLTKILSIDQQIKVVIDEFLIILEDICYSIDYNEITIELEINRCLLSTIILVIIEMKSINIVDIQQRLKIFIDQEKEFFSYLFTQQQLKLIDSHLISNEQDNQKNSLKSTNEKIMNTNDQSTTHREMFKCLESNDSSINTLIIEQFRSYLIDEQLPSNISLTKFIQELQTIFRNSEKFSQISLNEWEQLIMKNRGKIFSNNIQCDELLLNIIFIRLNMPNDSLKSIQHLTQSKNLIERNKGLEKLYVLLQNTQIKNENDEINHLPTVSNSLYQLVTSVVFDQKYPDSQVRKCLSTAKHSWLLNNDHRKKFNI